MPVDTTEIKNLIESELKDGQQMTFVFTPSQGCCELRFSKGNAQKVQKISWGMK